MSERTLHNTITEFRDFHVSTCMHKKRGFKRRTEDNMRVLNSKLMS